MLKCNFSLNFLPSLYVLAKCQHDLSFKLFPNDLSELTYSASFSCWIHKEAIWCAFITIKYKACICMSLFNYLKTCSIGPCMIVAHALLSRLSSSDASFSWTKCILRVINLDNASHAWQKPNITSRVLFYVNIFDNHATSCISRGKISFSAEQSASYALTTQIMYLTRNKNQTSPNASISFIITQPLSSLAKNKPHLMW